MSDPERQLGPIIIFMIVLTVLLLVYGLHLDFSR